MIIFNDTHLGTQRQAGTTPASQVELKQYLRTTFAAHVALAEGQHLVINGDLFDQFQVDPAEVIFAYTVLGQHLEAGGQLTLGMGNHDASAKGDRTSSFHLLAHVLQSRFPGRVQVVDHTTGLTPIAPRTWMIPHMLNQALFDLEIDKAVQAVQAAGTGGTLLLHCNILSPFAEHADHSLNLDEAALDRLVDAGWTLIVGHEHQMKTYKQHRCLLPGNQIPASVADCLGNRDLQKHYVEIDAAGVHLRPVLDLRTVYTEVDWRALDQRGDLADYRFLRVSGNCSAEEAAEMVTAVARLRQGSSAYVVANAVKVEGVAQMDGLAEMSLEAVSRFDVLAALLEDLDEREQQTVKELMG